MYLLTKVLQIQGRGRTGVLPVLQAPDYPVDAVPCGNIPILRWIITTLFPFRNLITYAKTITTWYLQSHLTYDKIFHS